MTKDESSKQGKKRRTIIVRPALLSNSNYLNQDLFFPFGVPFVSKQLTAT